MEPRIADAGDAPAVGRLLVLARERVLPPAATWVLDRCCARGDLRRPGLVDEAMQAHPTQHRWYVGVIATGRDARRRRLGAQVPARRHGFAATDTIEIPGGPSLTAMVRAARATGVGGPLPA